MTNYSLKLLASSLALAILSACGGGSSGNPVAATGSNATATTPVTPVVTPVVTPSTPEGPLSKYVGTWLSTCKRGEISTVTLSASNNVNTITATGKSEYFEKENCTGSIVATSTDAQALQMQYVATEANRSATLVDYSLLVQPTTPNTFNATFDVTSSVNVGDIVTGSGVTKELIDGQTKVTIKTSYRVLSWTIDSSSSVFTTALAIKNNELLICDQLVGAIPTFKCTDSLHR